MEYNPPSHPIHEHALALLQIFENIIANEFLPRMEAQARKSVSTSMDRGSEVAVLIEKLKEVEIKNRLIQSTGTVFVVPHTVSYGMKRCMP